MAQDNVEKFMRQATAQIGEYTGIIASNFATIASEVIVEEWANLLIEGLTKDALDFKELAETTKERKRRRADRGEAIPMYIDNPLIETGKLLSSIEFRIRSQPGQQFDIIEMSVRDDIGTGHGGDSMMTIAMKHEYGIGVPQRPVFSNTAMKLGYRQHRIFTSVASGVKQKVAKGYQSAWLRSKANKMENNSIENAAKLSFGKGKSDTVKLGKIIQNGADFKFQWITESES